MKVNETVKVIGFLCVAVMTIIMAEVFFFNRSYWLTRHYQPFELVPTASPSAHFDPESQLYTLIVEDELEQQCLMFISSPEYGEFENIDQPIHNLYFDFFVPDRPNLGIKIYPEVTTAVDSDYFPLPEFLTSSLVESSKYFDLPGDIKQPQLRFTTDIPTSISFQIRTLVANKPAPFSFSSLRVLALLSVVLLVERGWRWRRKFTLVLNLKNNWQKQFLKFTLMLLVSGFFLLSIICLPPISMMRREHDWQYGSLARALLRGQPHLLEEAPTFLSQMGDPYDYTLRGRSGEHYLWDVAYFNGKYYVYFGVVPVLLFYLPYALISDMILPNFLVVWIAASFFVAGVFALIYRICKQLFPRIAFGDYYLLCLLTMVLGNLVYFVKRPDIYAVPIIVGWALLAWGWYFWLSAWKDKKLNLKKLCFGSLLIALVAGCRPPLIFSAVPIVLVGWQWWKTNKHMFAQNWWRILLAFSIPFVIVAIFLMWYNFRRFGSVFDFGAAYNLTIHNLTAISFDWRRLFPGWFVYFLQPPNLQPHFPFLFFHSRDANYFHSYVFYEMCFGGILATNPIFGVLAFVPLWRQRLKQKRIWYLIVCLLGLAILVATISLTATAFITQRYLADFSYLVVMAVIIVILTVLEKGHCLKVIRYGLILCLVVGSAYALGLIFADDVYQNMSDYNPFFLLKAKYFLLGQ